MAQTNVPAGHALAAKIYGAAVFAEYVTTPSFSNRLTGPAPALGSATNILEKMQTSAACPPQKRISWQRPIG